MAVIDRVKLTNRRIKDFENTTGKPVWLYDDSAKALAVSVSPRGLKTFYAVTWAGGKTRRTRLGQFPEVTLDAARREAKGLEGDAARRQTVDIALETITKNDARTVGDLFAFWMETHAKLKKRTWERDQKEYDRLIRPALHCLPIVNVTSADVVKLVANIEGDPERGRGPAAKARALLSAMFTTAVFHRWVTANPVYKTHRPQFDPRQRYIKADEIGKFLAGIDSLESETARDYFRLLLYTGARRSNVAAMAWDEIDMRQETWTIPAGKSKGKKPMTVPLSGPAMEIVRRRAEKRGASPFVLPGRGRDGHYSDPKDAWNRIKAAAGIKDIRIHDIRRSMGNWQQDAGDSLRTIQQTLGHANIATTARFYTTPETAAIRASMDRVAEKMLAAGKAVK